METNNNSMKSVYEWVAFYESLATKLLDYKDNRKELIEKLKKDEKINFSRLEREGKVIDIDPFAVFGLFNRQNSSDETRNSILSGINSVLGINKVIPSTFCGVPLLDNRKLAFFTSDNEHKENDLDNLWEFFETAIQYAKTSSNEEIRDDFEKLFDRVTKPKGVIWNITTGLYWIRPNNYISLYSGSRNYLTAEGIISPEMRKEINKLDKITGKQYLWLCDKIKEKIESKQSIYHNFPELSHIAYNFDKSNSPDASKEEKMNSKNNHSDTITNISKNTILYGPPGTGKTYQTVVYAVAIIEDSKLEDVLKEDYEEVLRRYNGYKDDGFIEFTTFHQTYGYEEFIEGIKPVMSDEDNEKNEVQYEITSGLFKRFCERTERPVQDIGLNNAPTIWKVSLEGTGDNPTRTDCMANGHIRIGYDSYGANITSDTNFTEGGRNVINAFINKMKVGDIVLSCYSATTIDAIGIVTGEYEWHDEYPYYKRLRKVNWIVKGVEEEITKINGGSTLTLSSVYKLGIALADVMDIINHYLPSTKITGKKKNYVFIIDEINRGNISKIFGELITLIEPSKRIGQDEEIRVKLPYSQKLFGVPDNVYLIGTMNTADRSIATIDTALRRRFNFKEIMPDTGVLKDIEVKGIKIVEMLKKINERITVLYDREHTIGHAYFMPLKDSPTIETLARIFSNSIIPLLQEYFYEDYEKIRLVLGDNHKDNQHDQFVIAIKNDYSKLFVKIDFDFDETYTYEINKEAFNNIEAYRLI